MTFAARSRRRATILTLLLQYASLSLLTISGFILVPLYLSRLGAEIYGAWLATGQVLAWLTALDPGLSTIIQQGVGAAYGSEDRVRLGQLIATGVLLGALIAVAAGAAGMALQELHLTIVGAHDQAYTSQLSSAFRLAICGTSLLLFGFAVASVNQGLLGAAANGFVDLIAQASSIVSVLYLLFNGWGVVALGAQLVVRGGIYVTLGTAYLTTRLLRDRIRPRVSLAVLKEMGGLSLYTATARVTGVLSQNLDVVLIARYLGPSAAAAMELSRRPAQFIQLLGERPSVSLVPALSQFSGRSDARSRHIVVSGTRAMTFFAVCAVGGVLALNELFISAWVGRPQFIGQDLNLLIALSLGVSIFCITQYNILVALGSIRSSTSLAASNSVATALLLIVLVPWLGLAGALMSPIIARLLTQTWTYPRMLIRRVDKAQQTGSGVRARDFGGVALILFVAWGIWAMQLDGALQGVVAGLAYAVVCGAVGGVLLWRDLNVVFRRDGHVARMELPFD